MKPGQTVTLWTIDAADTKAVDHWERQVKQGTVATKRGTVVDGTYGGTHSVTPTNLVKIVVHEMAKYLGVSYIVVATAPFHGGQTPVHAAQYDMTVDVTGWSAVNTHYKGATK